MLSVQSPISGDQIDRRPNTEIRRRKPLEPAAPNNDININTSINLKPKQQQQQQHRDVSAAEWIEISMLDENTANKENIHPSALYYSTPPSKTSTTTDSFKIDQFDASLAEELTAIRKKLERLRLEKEKTEKILKDREIFLDLQMKELQNRGELQKQHEIEVDRLYRLKEIRFSSVRISTIRSLREKENQRKDEGISVTGGK